MKYFVLGSIHENDENISFYPVWLSTLLNFLSIWVLHMNIFAHFNLTLFEILRSNEVGLLLEDDSLVPWWSLMSLLVLCDYQFAIQLEIPPCQKSCYESFTWFSRCLSQWMFILLIPMIFKELNVDLMKQKEGSRGIQFTVWEYGLTRKQFRISCLLT